MRDLGSSFREYGPWDFGLLMSSLHENLTSVTPQNGATFNTRGYVFLECRPMYPECIAYLRKTMRVREIY